MNDGERRRQDTKTAGRARFVIPSSWPTYRFPTTIDEDMSWHADVGASVDSNCCIDGFSIMKGMETRSVDSGKPLLPQI